MTGILSVESPPGGSIFLKLGLAPAERDHRRVLAVLRYLGTS